LHSIENDDSWATTIQHAAKDDQRWTLQLVNGEIADAIPDLESFDLILIDDSKTSTQRAATIRAIARKQPLHPWIVIHDFEVEEYRDAASAFKHCLRLRAYNPETGVVANSRLDLRTLSRSLKQNAKSHDPDNIAAWSNVILQIL
jgi:precorrin-6B methylase 2